MSEASLEGSAALNADTRQRNPLFFVSIAVLMLACLILSSCGHASGVRGERGAGPSFTRDRIVIDLGHVRRTLPNDFFGINYVGFWDGAAGSRASAKALAQTPIKTVRFPGGAPADWYDWQTPYYKGWSRTSPLQVWRYLRSFGGSRVVFGTNYQGHLPKPPGKSYAVNSPQNAAAWVAYDRKMGIAADMEIGNEEDMSLLHKADDPAYAAYTARFNAQAKVMHRVDPGIRVLGPVGTNEYFWWGLDGLGMFLAGAGNRTGTGQVNGIALHFYKGSSWLDARGVAQYWLSSDGPWAAIKRMIRAHDSRVLPVYITEWNVGGADTNSAFNPTLGHALANADMLGAFALSGVAGEDYFDTHGGQSWGLLYGQGEDRPLDTPTPTYYATVLWKHMGNRLLTLQQSDDAATVSSAYATTRSAGSVQVLVINKQPVARKVTIAFQGASPSGHRLHVYTLQGTTGSVDDRTIRYDGYTMPSPQHRLPGPRNVGIVHGRTVSYRVPRYGAVLLDISGTSRDRRVRWKAVPTTRPAPPISFSVRGGVGHAVLKPGETQTLTATVRSNEDTGSILVDLEVYDTANTKVVQETKLVNLVANRPVTVMVRALLPRRAKSGTYHCDVGIFGPNWSPLYAWRANVASFNVRSS